MKRTLLKIDGMHCAGCAQSIAAFLGKKEGVLKAEVNYAGESALLEYDEERISPEEISSAVESMGYRVIAGGEKKNT